MNLVTGWVRVYHSGIDTHPKEPMSAELRQNEIHLFESSDHVRNLLDCVKTRAETICPIDVAVQADAISRISDIAMLTGKKLRWVPAKERFTNSEAANRMLTRAMRSPRIL